MPSVPQPAQAFAARLKSLLAERGMPAAAFANAAKVNPTLLSRILTCKRPPEKSLELWADSLALEGQERREFLRLGYLARANPLLAEIYEEQRAEIQRLKARLAGR